jgi:DNA-binding LytR/AlgR family response regulator
MNARLEPTPLSIVVVDDEPPARRRLVRMLSEHGNARVIAEASSVAESRETLARHDPDLVFLDVELGHEDAFALLNAAPLRAAVVLVTAYAEYAARAFDFEVLDYLLKPVRPERLLEALRRAERHFERRDASADVIEPSSAPLLLQGRRGVRLARLGDLLCITARDDHSELYLSDGSSYFDPTHMDDWERRLPARFVRTHRSHIANLHAAVGLTRRENGWALEVGSFVLPISRSRLPAIRRALERRPT